MSVRESLYKSLTENNWEPQSATVSCRGFPADCLAFRWPSPQALTHPGGIRFIAWHLRHPFLAEAHGARSIFGAAGRIWSTALRLDPPKMVLCHIHPSGGTFSKYYITSISHCASRRGFSAVCLASVLDGHCSKADLSHFWVGYLHH